MGQKILVGAAILVLGGILVWRIKCFFTRRREARSLATLARDPFRRLTTALDRFEHANRGNPTALENHFSTQALVFREKHEDAITQARANAEELPLKCLDAWGEAVEKAREARRIHQTMRGHVGLSNATQLLSNRADRYRNQLNDAIRGFRKAFRRTARHLSRKNRRKTENLIDGV